MLKSLIYTIIDEEDALKWKDLILKNRQKADFYVLGAVSPIGENLNYLKNQGNFDIVQISEKFIDFYIHRNQILDAIYMDEKYIDCDFFLSLDSDEEFVGNMPNYLNHVSRPLNSRFFYYYHENGKYKIRRVAARAFSGRNQPTWLGSVHDYLQCDTEVDVFTNDFYINHLRNSSVETSEKYLTLIKNSLDESFETNMAYFHEVIYKDLHIQKNITSLQELIPLLENFEIPTRIKGMMREIHKFRLFYYKYRIYRGINDIDSTIKYANEIKAMGQRIGIYFEWLVNKGDKNILCKEYEIFPIYKNFQKFELLNPSWI